MHYKTTNYHTTRIRTRYYVRSGILHVSRVMVSETICIHIGCFQVGGGRKLIEQEITQ